MAQEFNIPGLKEAIADIKILTDNTEKLSKDLLATAINADKAMKAFNGSGLKEYNDQQKKANDTQKETKTVVDKLQQAEDRLKFSKDDLAKKIAAVNMQTQQQNQMNKASVDVINQALEASKRENTSIVEARANNALLTQARNNVNTSTAEGKAQLVVFNDALDKNNKFIKDNADAALKQKMGIGDYAGGVKSAMEQTGLFSGKIGQLSNTAIGFVQSGAQAVTKIKDISDSVVTGAKNTATYVTAKLRMIGVEKESTIAIGASTLATEENAVATGTARTVVSGFSQAEKVSIAVTEADTIATLANTGATEVMSAANVGLVVTTEASAGAEVVATATTWGLNTALAVLLFPITAVVLAFGILVYIFKDFAPVINPIKDAFSALKAVFEVLVSSVFALVTGTKNLTEVFSTLGAETSKAADEAYKLAKAQREVIKAERELELSSAKAQAEITKYLTMSKNRAKSEEERMKYIEKAISIEKEDVSNQLKLNNQRIANARLVLSEGNKISEEDMVLLAKGNANYAQSIKKKYKLDQDYIDNLRKVQVERFGIIEKSSRVEEKAQNYYDKLADTKQNKADKAKEKEEKDAENAQKKAEDRAKKALDDEKKSFEFLISTKKLTLDNIINSYKQEENLESSNLAFVKSISLEKQAIADLERQKNKIGITDKKDLMLIEQKASEEIVKIKQEESKSIEKIKQDNADWELELYHLNNGTLIKEGATLTDLLINQERNRLKEEIEVDKNAMRVKLGIDKNLSDERLKAMLKTNASLTAAQKIYIKGIIKLEEDKEKADKKLNDTELATQLKNIDTEVNMTNRKFKLLNKGELANTKEELKNEKKALKDKLELFKDDAEKRKEIELQLAENKQKIAKSREQALAKGRDDALNNVIDIAGKESKIGKAAALAQIGITTQKAAMEAYANGMEYGGPAAPYLAALYAGLAIAAGVKSATEVVGINAFATGTMDAPYTGKAIIDELGAEIHTDAYGRIKSFGSDSGAHLTDIVKGDKIIPADISAMIKASLYAKSISHTQTIDYDKIGEQFGKHAGKIVNAVNNKREASLSVIVQKNITDRVMFKGRNV